MRDTTNRKTRRLQNHDYGGGGTYFLTIGTAHRADLFGEIVEDLQAALDEFALTYADLAPNTPSK